MQNILALGKGYSVFFLQNWIYFENMQNILIVGKSYTNTNLFYKTSFLSHNTFVYLSINDNSKSIIVVNHTDYEKALQSTSVSSIYTFNVFDYVGKIRRLGHKDLAFLLMLQDILKHFNIKHITVPKDFPFFFGNGLAKMGVKISIDCNLFVRERSIKTKAELTFIKQTQKALEKAMSTSEDIIRNASVNINKQLVYNKKILTTRYLKEQIASTLLKEDCKTFDTIVACGVDGKDPHFEYDSDLYAFVPIMIDIFPYHKYNRYFSDMSRSFVRGRPIDKVYHMYNSVLNAQEKAIKKVRAGVSARHIYESVCDLFNKDGYSTLREQKANEPMLKKGFIHSLGHGLGLSIHEVPFLFNQDIKLEEGNVITIEPGLYDPDLGGIRIEDALVVEKNGCLPLSNYHKEFIID